MFRFHRDLVNFVHKMMKIFQLSLTKSIVKKDFFKFLRYFNEILFGIVKFFHISIDVATNDENERKRHNWNLFLQHGRTDSSSRRGKFLSG